MPKTSKTGLSADQIAEKASRGEDVSAHFTNKFTVVRPVRRVNVDLTHGMLRELDERAARLNVSRQAVIKTLLSRALEKETRRSRYRPTIQPFGAQLLGGFQTTARLEHKRHKPLRAAHVAPVRIANRR